MYPSTPSSARRARLIRIGQVAGLAAVLALGPQAGMAYAASVDLAAASTGGLSTWIRDNFLSVGLLIVGAVIVFRAKSKDWAGSVVTAGIALLGLAVAAMGSGTTASAVGSWLVSLVWS
ncbi:hypothetical protein [Streptomyces sp. NPDC048623]|uniref:hypothetical protein n=1 Tax=Streptomyces sp. NPDC048623 TaxID=3155761 RepID=UPI0034126025